MSIAIARRIAATLDITSETKIRSLNQALLEYIRLTRQSSVVSSGVTKPIIVALLAWELAVESFTLEAGDKINATAIATMIDATLPVPIAAGDEFIVHNASTSTKVVQIEPNGHSIVGAGGTVTPSDTLVLELGDTAHLVAISSSVLEVV